MMVMLNFHHEILIPYHDGRRYAYKIAVYQTGFCMDSKEKRSYLGVETNNSRVRIRRGL